MNKYDRRADTDAELLGFERGNGSATTGGPPVPPIVSVALYEEWKGTPSGSKPMYSMSSWLDTLMHVGFWVFGATAGCKPRHSTSFADRSNPTAGSLRDGGLGLC